MRFSDKVEDGVVITRTSTITGKVEYWNGSTWSPHEDDARIYTTSRPQLTAQENYSIYTMPVTVRTITIIDVQRIRRGD